LDSVRPAQLNLIGVFGSFFSDSSDGCRGHL
jgi:hypothetical protein